MTDKQRPAGFLDRWSARKRQTLGQGSSTAADSVDESAEPTQPRSVPESAPANQMPVDASLSNSAGGLSSDLDGSRSVARSTDTATGGETGNPDAIEPTVSDETPLLTDADMPPIESLTSDSDISGFFNRGVSAALKKAALRHVFMLPKYNVRDGLNDYDGDYTSFEPLGDTITSDMKWHTARKERDRLEAEARELEVLQEQRAELDSAEHDVQDQENLDEASDELQAAQSEQSATDTVDEELQDACDERETTDSSKDELHEAQIVLDAQLATDVLDSTLKKTQAGKPANSQRAYGGKLTRVGEHPAEKHQQQSLGGGADHPDEIDRQDIPT